MIHNRIMDVAIIQEMFITITDYQQKNDAGGEYGFYTEKL